MSEPVPPMPPGLVPPGVDPGLPDRHHRNLDQYGLLRAVIWGVVLGGLLFCWMGYRRATGPYAFNHQGGYLMIALGVPGVLAGLGLAVWHRGHSTMRAWTTPRGLAWCNALKGGFVPWDELVKHYRDLVKILHHGRHVRTDIFLTFETSTGQRVMFRNNVLHILDLADRLDREIAQRRLPAALASVRAGQAVAFDKLSLSAAGVGWGADTLPWDDVESFEVSHGFVRVNKKGKTFAWASTTAGALPNFPIALALVQELRPQLLKASGPS
jgi:hypothetical protein